MQISTTSNVSPSVKIAEKTSLPEQKDSKLKETFAQFVGETFFAQLIQSARSGLNESPYFSGGRAEEVFQGQLDQVLAEKMTEASGSQIADPMYELMMLPKSR